MLSFRPTDYVVPLYFFYAKSFLAEHGLQLSSEKNCIFSWKIGERLHFIGFIFHKIDRAWFHSRITTKWKVRKRFTRKNLHIYPNLKEIMSLKHKTKSVLTENRDLSPYQIIELINPILHGWGNYFEIDNFFHTFSLLDHSIWHRSWRYLYHKFPKTPRPILVS